MTDTARRAFIGAIAAAPVLVAAGALSATASASPSADLPAMRSDDLLAYAAANSADPAFAALCDRVLIAFARMHSAARLLTDAGAAAEAATPPYPPGLCYRARYTHMRGELKGQVDEWDERCAPSGANDSMLWNLSHWRARDAGISYAEANAQLRAEYAAWRAAADEADAAYRVEELNKASEASAVAVNDALEALYVYPARSVSDLLIKIGVCDDEEHDYEIKWERMLPDVRRVLQGMA